MSHARGVDLTDRLAPDPSAPAAVAYLALGSNVGQREATVLRAARALVDLSYDGHVRLSSLYETAPVGCGPMRDFVNAVAQLRSLHPARELLNRVQVIERMLGRQRGHNEPRELDIDIITFGDEVMASGDLTLPHPGFASRAFVLIPLQEVAVHFQCPATGLSIGDLIAALPSREGIHRISSRAIHLQEAS